MDSVTQIVPLGTLADLIYQKKQDLKEMNDAVSALKSEIEGLEHQALASLEASGLTSARGSTCSISITEREVVQIEDIELFHNYILSTSQPYLQQARPASKACLELLKSGEEIPGIRSFSLQSISTRKV